MLPPSAQERFKLRRVIIHQEASEMTSLASATDIHPIENSSLPFKVAIALALAALADWLLYDERLGLSLAIFACAIASASLLANHATLDRQRAALGGIILAIGLLPAVEEVSTLSLLIVIASLALGLLLATNPDTTELGERMRALRNLFLFGPFRFFREVPQVLSVSSFTRGIAIWFIPALLSTVFVALFAAANPMIEKWVYLLNPKLIFDYVSLSRALFWTMMLALVWPFVHVRWRRNSPATAATESAEPEHTPGSSRVEFLGASTVLRSLILFNLLFAAQSVLDATYLWGHAALPADVTYAGYAHRGAYPLILTALLAGAFVLVAMRPGGAAEKSRVIRPLVYLWVAQNVLLVASSILRLDLYVQIYFLTYWRVAAFIWMLLVAVGLLLIVARIVSGRSNGWLIGANLIVLTAVLYICSLMNFAALVADYNVNHSRETGGKDVKIDMIYLTQLGPQALPAIDRALQIRGYDPNLVSWRDSLVEEQRKDMASWRSWGFRSWRLQRYLDARQSSAAAG
jgi:hypothetical protein